MKEERGWCLVWIGYDYGVNPSSVRFSQRVWIRCALQHYDDEKEFGGLRSNVVSVSLSIFFFRLTPMWPRLLSTGEHTVPGEGILSTRTHAHTPTQVQTWKSLFRTFWNTSLCIARIGACLLLKKKKKLGPYSLFCSPRNLLRKKEWVNSKTGLTCWMLARPRREGKR